jgi:hypothetical protein
LVSGRERQKIYTILRAQASLLCNKFSCYYKLITAIKSFTAFTDSNLTNTNTTINPIISANMILNLKRKNYTLEH